MLSAKVRHANKNMASKRIGRLIVIDGTDGSGKGTQVALLLKRLKREGYKTYLVDFPQYGKKSAGPVEEYLNGKYGMLNPYQGSLLYAVDRLDASFAIRKALADGRVVIANRYVTANAGHQGAKISDVRRRKKFFHWLDELEYGAIGLPRPDLTLVLRVPAHIAQTLVDKKSHKARAYANGKKRDLHEADLEHLQRAEQTYVQIARTFPHAELLECTAYGALLSIREVHELIWKKVQRFI